ncbi:hypothetical protein U0035_13750 [Niabella yanshanensis]|uniref:3-oxoacyl-ACP synthase n=1 Tax=Niabella yanshanensis TaxID=577386 RepID=A0ABZ0W2N4_9BACT|nr:hypothetical protein [Niabella yanshanensis]WQD36732.1 hypothetical protein U0035_13750 [Niabella yanshanensis]
MSLKHQETYISGGVCIRNRTIQSGDHVVFMSDGSSDLFSSLYEKLEIDYPRFFKMDALCKLGIAATHILLKDFDTTAYQPGELGIVLSNRSGSIEADINYFESSKSFPSPSLFVYTLPNIVIGEISIRYGFKGENAFFISEQFDADWMVFYVNNLMQYQGIKACICGWVDVENDEYDARFFLIERGKENGLNFTADNLHVGCQA